jgi:hypothetical protein
MPIKFSEDLFPLTDLKINPERVVDLEARREVSLDEAKGRLGLMSP